MGDKAVAIAFISCETVMVMIAVYFSVFALPSEPVTSEEWVWQIFRSAVMFHVILGFGTMMSLLLSSMFADVRISFG